MPIKVREEQFRVWTTSELVESAGEGNPFRSKVRGQKKTDFTDDKNQKLREKKRKN